MKRATADALKAALFEIARDGLNEAQIEAACLASVLHAYEEWQTTLFNSQKTIVLEELNRLLQSIDVSGPRKGDTDA